MKPNCLKCRLFFIEDYGWSDWTVEGATIQCLRGVFNNCEKALSEKMEEEEKGMLEMAAENCKFFVKGEPLETNVDYDGDKKKEIEKRLEESEAIISGGSVKNEH